MRLRICGLLLASLWTVPAALAQGHVAILLPGAGGPVPQDFLMRNQASFEASGIRTVVTTSAAGATAAAAAARQRGGKPFIVAMSKGVTTAAAAIGAGAPIAGAVFVSGVYGPVIGSIGSPAKLPPTLVVHHRADQCPLSSPAAAQQFVGWAGGRATVQWINSAGGPDRRPCAPFGAHGFFQQDAGAISAIVGFIRSR